jgi:octopine/nopaline transport system permease protein
MSTDLLTLLTDQGWALALAKGCALTIAAALGGTALGGVMGFPMAVLRWRAVPVLSQAVAVYSGLVRGVPGLLVIYLIFFGGVQAVETLLHLGGNSAILGFIMAVIAIGLISCAYSVEVFRAALQAIPRGQVEAALAVGMSDLVAFRRIIAPLALRHALGGLNNVWQMTVKDTSLVSVVGLQELMRVAAIAAGVTRSALVFYILAAALYLAITLISQALFLRAEKALNLGFGGRS